ncbi:MAG TPA: DUF4010 domain-containing protein [Xanthobacteraceae bacterium]|nr:DUF4010 domain-containing protein [Xanthobacteraceae bacterium]
MVQAPSLDSAALLLGLSFFLGLAFEDFFNRGNIKRPGGIRTFPMLALGGGVLYLFDPVHFIPFTGGLLVLGSWLFIYYQKHAGEPDEEGESNVGLVVPVLNVHAYVLGAITLALPHWIAVATTVVAVLLLTGRAQLHALARRIDIDEIITAGEFLILTGIILPLLPNEPVTTLTKITPRQVWLALVVVCTFSYVSYLAQRYWAAAARGLWMAALGGLYSSTAATVVLARQAKAEPTLQRQAQAGITLATGIMYLRIAVITAIFNLALARILAPPLIGLALVAFAICAVQYWWVRSTEESKPQTTMLPATSRNPLEIIPAAAFAGLFVATSLASSFATSTFGTSGIYALAAIIGVSDIDPFVLNLVQGGTTGITNTAIAAAILIAASSNNMLKAFYAVSFGGRMTAGSAAALVVLAGAGAAVGIFMAISWS